MFASLGTVLLDTVCYVDENREEIHLGGGGLYAALGARIWLSPDEIRLPTGGARLGLSNELLKQLDSFGEQMWTWEDDASGKALLQAVIEFRGGNRSFAYLNPRPQQTIASLSSFSSLHCVHFCCSPDSIAESLNLLKNAPHRPVIVYEPIPFSCKPSRFPEIVSILPLIDVFSPNHKELSLLFDNFHATVEALTEKLASLGGRTVVIRAGSRGCYIANENPALGHCQKQWMPAYWTAEEVDQVRGTTGAGNSFLGGLCAGILLESPLDIFRAAMYGSVSASFVVQQTGLPVLGMDGKWNGEEPGDRLTRYMTALPVTIINDSAIK